MTTQKDIKDVVRDILNTTACIISDCTDIENIVDGYIDSEENLKMLTQVSSELIRISQLVNKTSKLLR